MHAWWIANTWHGYVVLIFQNLFFGINFFIELLNSYNFLCVTNYLNIVILYNNNIKWTKIQLLCYGIVDEIHHLWHEHNCQCILWCLLPKGHSAIGKIHWLFFAIIFEVHNKRVIVITWEGVNRWLANLMVN